MSGAWDCDGSSRKARLPSLPVTELLSWLCSELCWLEMAHQGLRTEERGEKGSVGPHMLEGPPAAGERRDTLPDRGECGSGLPRTGFES